MTCRIEGIVFGEDPAMLHVSGQITRQDVDLLRTLLEQERNGVVINLKDVVLVDREAAKLLASYESKGAQLRNCSAYIREWVTRERADRESLSNG